MFICYIDEAGCTGVIPDANSDVQPVFVIAGIMLPQQTIKSLTVEWIQLKQRHFPNKLSGILSPRFHDWMAAEIKGSELRKAARHTGRNQRRFASMVIGHTLDLLERHRARIAGRVFVKPIGGAFSGTPVYTSTAQSISSTFQNLLEHHNTHGLVIADSRNRQQTPAFHTRFSRRRS